MYKHNNKMHTYIYTYLYTGMSLLWQQGVPKMKLRVYQLDRVVKWTLPKLHKHLIDIQLTPEVLVAQWFITLFTYTVPLELTLRVFDYIFLEGWSGMFRVALALLKSLDSAIRDTDLEGVGAIMKEWRNMIGSKGTSSLKNREGEIMRIANVMVINDDVLMKLQESFALEVIHHSEMALSNAVPTTSTSSNAGSGPAYESVKSIKSAYESVTSPNSKAKAKAAMHPQQDAWLDRYGDVVSDEMGEDILKVRDELQNMEVQMDVDKQYIQAKIVLACEAHRDAQTDLDEAIAVHTSWIMAVADLQNELEAALENAKLVAHAASMDEDGLSRSMSKNEIKLISDLIDRTSSLEQLPSLTGMDDTVELIGDITDYKMVDLKASRRTGSLRGSQGVSPRAGNGSSPQSGETSVEVNSAREGKRNESVTDTLEDIVDDANVIARMRLDGSAQAVKEISPPRSRQLSISSEQDNPATPSGTMGDAGGDGDGVAERSRSGSFEESDKNADVWRDASGTPLNGTPLTRTPLLGTPLKAGDHEVALNSPKPNSHNALAAPHASNTVNPDSSASSDSKPSSSTITSGLLGGGAGLLGGVSLNRNNAEMGSKDHSLLAASEKNPTSIGASKGAFASSNSSSGVVRARRALRSTARNSFEPLDAQSSVEKPNDAQSSVVMPSDTPTPGSAITKHSDSDIETRTIFEKNLSSLTTYSPTLSSPPIDTELEDVSLLTGSAELRGDANISSGDDVEDFKGVGGARESAHSPGRGMANGRGLVDTYNTTPQMPPQSKDAGLASGVTSGARGSKPIIGGVSVPNSPVPSFFYPSLGIVSAPAQAQSPTSAAGSSNMSTIEIGSSFHLDRQVIR
jgi:hypothetical protein